MGPIHLDLDVTVGGVRKLDYGIADLLLGKLFYGAVLGDHRRNPTALGNWPHRDAIASWIYKGKHLAHVTLMSNGEDDFGYLIRAGEFANLRY